MPKTVTVMLFTITLFVYSAVALEQIHIGGLFPGPASPVRLIVEPAFRMAVEHINADPDLLPNHELVPIVMDSACNPSAAVTEFLSVVEGYYNDCSNKTNIAGIIGPACSEASEAVSRLGFPIPVLSYGSTSPSLSSTTDFPYFVRTVPSDLGQIDALIDIIKNIGITKLYLLYGPQQIHVQFAQFFNIYCREQNITIVGEFSVDLTYDSPIDIITEVKKSGVTAFIISSYTYEAEILMKEARTQGITGKGYTWFGTEGWAGIPILEKISSGNDYDFVNGVIGAAAGFQESEKSLTFQQQINDYSPSTGYGPYTPYSYDTVYVLAYALHDIMEIQNYDIDDDGFYQNLFSQILHGTNFEGVTGTVSFTVNGDRISRYNFNNIQNGVSVNVGSYSDGISEFYDGDLIVSGEIWRPGQPLHTIISLGVLVYDGLTSVSYLKEAMEVALEDINSNGVIIPDSTMVGYIENTDCDSRTGVNAFFNTLIKSGETIVGVIGPGCSVVAQPVAQIAEIYDMSVTSFASTSPSLSDSHKYPHFRRSLSPDNYLAKAWFAFCKHNGWKRIAVLHTHEELHSLFVSEFLELIAQENDITVLTSEVFEGHTTSQYSEGIQVDLQLQEIKKQEARIIFFSSGIEDFDAVMSKAYDMDLLGPGYVWIGTDSNIHTRNNLSYNTSKLYQGCIGFVSDTGDLSTKKNTFYEKLLKRVSYNKELIEVYGEFIYDVAWSYAYAIDDVIHNQQLTFESTSDFKLKISESLQNVSFEGITGDYFYNENGDRILPYNVIQLLDNGKTEVVAKYNPNTEEYDEIRPILWPGYDDNIPSDRPADIIHGVDESAEIIITCLAIGGFLCSMSFICLVIFKRNHSIIVAARPSFCILISITTSLTYVAMITSQHEMCIVTNWLFNISLYSTLGLIYAKAYHIWKLFNEREHGITVITDKKLLLGVMIPTIMIVIFLVIQTIVDPVVLVHIEDSSEQFVYHPFCDSEKFTFQVISYVVLGLALILGSILAFRTRDIRLNQYNESQYISLGIYNCLFSSAVLIPIQYLVPSESITSRFVIENLAHWIMATVFVGGLLFSKINQIYIRPEVVDPPKNDSNIDKYDAMEVYMQYQE
eukprot:TRINITY_DN2176_c0_g1_i1.p1 TRINITY_DN2176_c0_g1~~TRINITY_DN2176_c0_g1_i1.p1  ORF type:complete len:1107 (-),score=219.59 TRINITY_DN2176_c0_g1_i1:20-3340(-)